jgi:adenylate cyclase
MLRELPHNFLRIGAEPEDNDHTRQQKQLFLVATFFNFWAGFVWGVIYLAFNEPLPASIPWAYGILSVFSVAVFARVRNFALFRFTQFALILLLPFLLQIMLGGFIESSAVVLWSLIAPMGALIFERPRRAVGWFAAYLAFVIMSGFLQGRVDRVNNLPPVLIISFFVLNIGAISAIVFGLLHLFITQREQAYHLLRLEEEKSNNLLLNILPREVAATLKNNPGTIADHYDQVSILFADLVNFTPLSAELSPRDLVGVLSEIFSHFDSLVDEYGVEKIETVGDEYMAACGVPRACPEHAVAVARLALQMCSYIGNFRAINGRRLQIRVGMHSGPIVAGVIGKKKFAFELFGDTVNTANRMQSHGAPGKIQISRDTFELLKDKFVCEPRGRLEVKGKGEMETWYLLGEKEIVQ